MAMPPIDGDGLCQRGPVVSVGGSGAGEPQWMTDCIEHYWRTEGRGPSTGELLAWREGESSCRMEREVDRG